MSHLKRGSIIVGILLWIGLFAGLGYARDYYVNGDEQKWVYDAMDLFAQKGYIQDYPKQWIGTGHELSRFEIAFYIKQLLEGERNRQSEKKRISSDITVLLQKLMVEFTDELTALGIKTTDVDKISPNLVTPHVLPRDYEDLDLILGSHSDEKDQKLEPCYYYGQYYNSLEQKAFLFVPSEHLDSADSELLGTGIDNINIVYQPASDDKQLYLVVKGNLPLAGKRINSGYFLFPIAEQVETSNLLNSNLDKTVLSLVDEVNHLEQVDRITRLDGSLSLKGYLKLNLGLDNQLFYRNIDQGLKIGSMLIYSDYGGIKSNNSDKRLGLPSYNLHPSAGVDLDVLKKNDLESYQINIAGKMNLTPQTSLFGGIDFIYKETAQKSLFDGVIPPESKYSAGVNYQMNDAWTLLTYQSFVNSDSQWKSKLLSTTSLGVEYNDWLTVWFAYQMVDFNDPKVTGLVSFRF